MTTHTITAPSAVAAQSITKTYGTDDTQVTALDDVSVAFHPGDFTAIMGPSGSGKSTLMHCLAGLDTVDSGQVAIGKTVITGMSDHQLTILRRKHVGFIFQAFNLVPTLSARDNILLPLDLAGTKVDQAWFDQIIEVLGLGDRLAHHPHELSGGQQQRVAVARALLTRPDVVFADEPTGALDSATGTEVLQLLARSARDMGQTIIMVTHDPHAAAYADNVVLLKDGAIVGRVEDPTADTVLAALAELGA
ncbi:ABC transporter ATP-binding protein [Enteractinococcus coprophilus]|uniref:Putative ABC transport system ATP-binding protein n=1 Tax=Enteractinococcus coprophilus TaxID=1027633 RepID=A0A543ANC0_9MICC|nr:ABC transporter ATP-binding protein [Enteractinococcus coprophilus]TQL74073.1 putative ABC transport system ATP-binding protein [Enteractinococcus coprophilus]